MWSWPSPFANSIERRCQRDYDGAHLRMDVTKDVADPGPVEVHHSRTARFIQAKIESLPFK